MKIITLLITLLLSMAVHASAEQLSQPIAQQKLREVERQFIKNGISEENAHATVQAMVQSRFTLEQMVQVNRQMAPDDRLGIINRAMRDKIHEGIAKNVPPENILAATIKVRNRFELAEKFAHDIGQQDNALLANHYAHCLVAGLTVQDANQLAVSLQARVRNQNNRNSGRLALETLLTARDMVRQKISSATTVGVLQSALKQGYNGEEMLTLRHYMGKMNGDVEKSAMRIGAAIQRGAQAGELEGLGQGNGSNSSGNSSSGSSGSGNNGNDSSGSSGSGGSGAGSNSSGSESGSSGGSGGSGSGGSGSGGSGDSGGNGGGSGGRK
ncbi:MAG: hypothetical protein ACI8ZB_002908 [Desulforhopalus sp.]|jgi:hypothetical protein